MSYLDRLLPGLVLTSPNGDVFNALWAGNALNTSPFGDVKTKPGNNLSK